MILERKVGKAAKGKQPLFPPRVKEGRGKYLLVTQSCFLRSLAGARRVGRAWLLATNKV